MQTQYRSRWRVVVAGVLGLAAANAGANGRAGDPGVIVEWNGIVEATVPAGGLSPPRHYAMVHIAMFDAVDAIARTHRPYVARLWAPWGAAAEVAAAQAAHDVLAAQFPGSVARFDAALAARLAAVPPGRAQTGIAVGKAAAAAVLAWRKDDGWGDVPAAYTLPEDLPGAWQPTPPGNAAAAFRQMQTMRPFALVTSTQYLPAPPPTLTSERYATDYDETKLLGAVGSTARTSEQAQLARLMASVTTRTVHWALWNQAARQLAQARGLSLVETARLFALVNVAIQDGVQTSHAAKFAYGAWRPQTAIRRGDFDLNPATIGDATWTPLLATPPYPSHPGNMACVSASAARAMQLYFGADDLPFVVTWLGNTGNPDVQRTYTSFSKLAEDQANSRIWGGIHFRFESEASREMCPKVAEWVYANYMRPLRVPHAF